MQPTVLAEPAWRDRRATHEVRVDEWLGRHLDRRRRGAGHPVEDFLFTYYSYRPAQLRRWHPGPAVVLAGARAADLGPDYIDHPRGAGLDAAAVTARRSGSIAWIRELLGRTAERPPHLGCFGMHEWAMVYQQTQEELRHRGWPLRLSPDETAQVVRDNRIRCSHFDAYRFFTESARPLNLLAPSRETQTALEQPGCLHANMDLYKWAYKLSPLVPSEVVADGFEFAREIRTLDMRASPYDLTDLGYDPIRVETADGRAEYSQRQREVAERSSVLRSRLVAWCDRALTLARGAQDATKTATAATPAAHAPRSPTATS